MKVALDRPQHWPAQINTFYSPPCHQAGATALVQKQPHQKLAKSPSQTSFGRGFISDPGYFGAAVGPFLKTLGIGGGTLGAIAGFMSFIEASQTTQLMTIDVAGFVLPRTVSEGYHRGVDAGREAFIREAMGTVCNVYLAGWLGLAGLIGAASVWKNPKAVNLTSWIPSGRLDYMGDMVKEALQEASSNPMTRQDIKARFLEKALARIESSDGIAKLPEYNAVFPHQGKLAPAVQQQIKSLFLTGDHGADHARNIDEAVLAELNTPQNQAGWQKLKGKATKLFRDTHNLAETDALSASQQKALSRQLKKTKGSFIADHYRQNRLRLSKALRNNEKTFIDKLYNLAIDKGGMTDDILLNSAHGHHQHRIGRIGLKRYLTNLSHFMEEYLNRSLTEPFGAATPKQALSKSQLKAVGHALFDAPKSGSLLSRWLPNLKDGLLNYTYKTHGILLVSALLGTMAAGCSVAYFNHKITRTRHKGDVFFPGERYQELRLRQEQGGSR